MANQRSLVGVLLLLTGAISLVVLGLEWNAAQGLRMIDFDAVYYASQVGLHHGDPYNSNEVEQAYSNGGPHTHTLLHARRDLLPAVTVCINLPTTLLVMTPLAMLPWGTAHHIWIILTVGCLVFSAFLMWDVGADYAPRFSGVLAALMLFGSQILLETGNTAGIAVGLCVIAVWCMICHKFEWLGVACLAFSLCIKPQDAGLVWLFLLLAGGTYRRRAWQSLAACAIFIAPALLWAHSLSPEWIHELHSNLSQSFAPGQGNSLMPAIVDPSIPSSMLVSLQTVFRIFTANARLCNLLSYAVCAPFLLVLIIHASRSSLSSRSMWMAVAVVAPLAMLPIYHRQHDTRLLLLAIPGCAILWARPSWVAKLAAATVALGMGLIGNIPLQVLGKLTRESRASMPGLPGHLFNATVGRPAPLVMLGMCGVFLWCLTSTRSCSFSAQTAIGSEETMPGLLSAEILFESDSGSHVKEWVAR